MDEIDYLEKAKNFIEDTSNNTQRQKAQTYALISIAESLAQLVELKQPKTKPKNVGKEPESGYVRYTGNDW